MGFSRPALLLTLLLATGCVPRVEAPPASAPQTVAVPAPPGNSIEDAYVAAMRLGQERNGLGDRDGAERLFRTALDLAEAHYGTDSPAVAAPLMQLALTVSYQRRIAEADALFRRAERLVARPADPWDVPRLGSYEAIHLASLDKLGPALEAASAASRARRDLLQFEQRRGDGMEAMAPGMAELAHGLVVEATIALRLGQLDRAELSANLAHRILAELSQVPLWWIADVDELLGLVEAERARYGDAVERLDAAIELRRLSFGERRPVALSILSLGRVHLREGRDEEAVAVMRRGLEILRSDVSAPATLTYQRLADFLDAASARARLDPADAEQLSEEMFQTSQLSWRGATARTISLTVARLAGGNSDTSTLLADLQQTALRRDAARLALGREAAKPGEARDLERLDELRATVILAVERTESLSRRLEERFPRLSRLLDPSPVSAAELGKLLAPDEALVSFAVGREGAWVFAVRGGVTRAAKLSTDAADLETRVRQLRLALVPGPGAALPAFDLAAAQALYQTLFGPIDGMIAGANHLIIVPDGPLQSLPLGVLVAGTTPPVSYESAQWLARRAAISTVPSARAFADLRQLASGSAAPLPLFGMADPVLSGTGSEGMATLATACREDRPVPPEQLRQLARLPDTATELQRVGRAFGAGSEAILTGANATEPRLRSMDLSRYRVLYFATHGLLPGELRCQSEPALVLTPPASLADSTLGDGLLTASEIAALSIDADLVVLSACNTASASGEFGGEALSGLARAFFHAGARALLVTHWQIDSLSTAELMTATFGAAMRSAGAARDRGLAEALRRAQLSLVANRATAHPFFWGAFSLIGDGRVGERASGA